MENDFAKPPLLLLLFYYFMYLMLSAYKIFNGNVYKGQRTHSCYVCGVYSTDLIVDLFPKKM